MLIFSFQGRSKSLTSIDALNPLAMDLVNIDVDQEKGAKGDGEGTTDRLSVPIRVSSVDPAAHSRRRRKLSTSGKV